MKKVAFLFLAMAGIAALNARAKDRTVSVSKKVLISQDCTVTRTGTSSAQVPCPNGNLVTVPVTSTSTATAATCEDAAANAQIIANTQSQASVAHIIKFKTYFCD